MTVRRTDTPIETHRLGYTRLFRDDLEKIAVLLSEVGQLSITCDNLEATVVSDFADPLMPYRPNKVVMEASNGKQRLKVEMGCGVGNLTIEEPNTLTEGIKAKIGEICDGSTMDTMVAGRAVNLWALVAMIPLICALVLTYFNFLSDSSAVFGVIIAGIIVWFSAGAFVFRFREKSDIVIVNVCRADKPSFFRRTRDEWVVEMSVMITGLVLGYIIGHLAK